MKTGPSPAAASTALPPDVEDDCSGTSDPYHGSDHSTNLGDDDHEQTKAAQQETVLAQRETKDVFRLKMSVLIVLVGAAIGVATSVYFYLTYTELKAFRDQFDDDSHKVFESVGASLDKSMGALDSFAVMMVSAAKMTNQTWPCVVIDDFAVRMSKVLPLSDAIVIYFNPVVTPEEREKWEEYSVQHDYWVDEGMAVQAEWDGYHGPVEYSREKYPIIHGDFEDIPRNITRNLLPNWQTFPVIPNTVYTYNWDALAMVNPAAFLVSLEKHKAVFTQPYMIPSPDDEKLVAETKVWADFNKNFLDPDDEPFSPMTDIIYPVVNSVKRVKVAGAADYNPNEHEVVGLLTGNVYWRSMVRDILPPGSDGIHVVFSNPCTDSFTFMIHGPTVEYLGVHDHHDVQYDKQGKSMTLHELGAAEMANSVYSGAPLDDSYCPITLSLYPSDTMKDRFTTHNPVVFTIIVLVIFAFVSLVFALYDRMVERRQVTVMNTAVRSTAIVSSLFPSEVHERLYTSTAAATTKTPDTAKGKLKTFLRENQKAIANSTFEDSDVSNPIAGAPIAELYPDTTVLFADICGFTSWSSERHPAQVFTLLETVYAAFDAIAKRRGVFKVETIGDCYVAVVGLPTPRKNHALVMSRFARDCRDKMACLTAELGSTLGPGTADLAMRFGLNSGPTTAGVLRGEKSRFQLFGDTVNTAARMESNGQRNKIQVSQKTADLIRQAGKEHWLTQREEKVDCKGKGQLTTYWCEPNLAAGSVFSVSAESRDDSGSDCEGDRDGGDGGLVKEAHDAKLQRLVEWNVSLFSGLIVDVMSSRTHDTWADVEAHSRSVKRVAKTPIQEISDEISLLDASSSSTAAKALPRDNDNMPTIEMSASAVAQLRELITLIARAYRPSNPFHNFDHCSHVVMSTKKLLHRITEHEKEVQHETKSLKSCTYGLTTSPLAKMAIVFAALIHDLDHAGVSNAQLVEEQNPLAVTYNGQSVAEQNSVDMAWKLLMRPEFAEMRQCVCATQAELSLFRQIVVNAVMATDLFDKQLKTMREARWNKSFIDIPCVEDEIGQLDMSASNRRATIIIDLIIQASDVSHTMQHFTVYKKWNMRLLAEMYNAYQQGRMVKDPTIGWYDGELWFFDNYVIPLAQKLRECHVFGVSCDEFLDYAIDNRAEWEVKGKAIVKEAKTRLQLRALVSQTSATAESTLEI